MNNEVAKLLVESLVERLEPKGTKFRLPDGIISQKEREALLLLAGLDPHLPAADASEANPTAVVSQADLASASVRIVPPRFKIKDSCIDAPADASALLCIDFGTAFSKASIWLEGEDAPIPLDLGTASGTGGLLVDSSAFIDDGHLFFGPEAVRRHAALGDVSRLPFASPKELLTHDHESFHTSRPNTSIDPTGSFRSRDLLALYLAFLTAISCDRAAAHGVGPHVLRRFAAPGWSNSQVSASSPHFEHVAKQMNELLVDAQVLADSIPLSAWATGLDIGMARSALDDLGLVTADRKRLSSFVERPVLEAVAAATGVQDRLVNRRPQVLVIDVGAGTTDIGVFKYSIAEEEARVATYKNGLSALKIAGNRLDDALIDLAWSQLGYASDSQLKDTHARRMRIRVRDLKRTVFTTGATNIELDGFETVKVEQAQLEQTPAARYFAREFETAVKKALNGAGVGSRNFLQTNEPNVAVFTGGGGTLPMLRRLFDKPIELEGGNAVFEVVDPIPNWLESYGPDVRQIFPQLAVSTGGCAPHLPDERNAVLDTSVVGARSIGPMYR